MAQKRSAWPPRALRSASKLTLPEGSTRCLMEWVVQLSALGLKLTQARSHHVERVPGLEGGAMTSNFTSDMTLPFLTDLTLAVSALRAPYFMV